MSLTKKIDFAVIIGVNNANPNGDPLNGNRPRTNYDGYGEISDVCIKRKIRNRLMDNGQAIFVQSDDYRNDEYRSLNDRYKSVITNDLQKKSKDEQAAIACKSWFDVRAFGQVFSFKETDKEKSVSTPVRGPVSIQSAFSVEPVDISSMQIAKSVNLTTNKENPSQKSPDTFGIMKHRVDRGVYVTYGSINRQLASKTGFTDVDAEILKAAMVQLFENDESSARPAGSMEVIKVIWWTHEKRTESSAKVHRSLTVKPDGTYELTPVDGVEAQAIDAI